MAMIPRLKVKYQEEVAAVLLAERGYRNTMQVPRIEKVVVNTCLKEATSNFKILETAAGEISQITGQKPVIRRARKSIANFKLREGMPLGAKVTLRRDAMWYFLDRLISVAIPRIRDFRGLNPRAFDGRGSYSMGLTEQIIFPEINYDKVERITGMNITIVTSSRTDDEARSLLKHLGMPFRE
jgi:large subunit ribosomal protein L5